MRIIEVICDNRKGGISARAIATAPALRRSGIETVFVLPNEKGDVAEALRSLDFEVHQLTLRRPHPRRLVQTCLWLLSLPISIFSLMRVIRSSQSEVVHVNGFLGLQAVTAACFARVPIVWHLAGTASYPSWLVTVVRPFLRKVAFIVPISERVRTYFLGNHPVNDRETVIHEPVDADRFVQDAESEEISVREEFSIPADATLITCVGNLSPVKGHEYLVRAASGVCADRNDVHFVLVGQLLDTQRAYVKRINEAIDDHGLRTRFSLLGKRNDVSRILSESDVFVLSSLSEGTPISVLEAMAHGLPVVATNVGGLPEQVEEGVTGLLVEARDAEQMRQALVTLVENRELRKTLGMRGGEKVRREYSMQQYLESFVAVLEKCRRHWN